MKIKRCDQRDSVPEKNKKRKRTRFRQKTVPNFRIDRTLKNHRTRRTRPDGTNIIYLIQTLVETYHSVAQILGAVAGSRRVREVRTFFLRRPVRPLQVHVSGHGSRARVDRRESDGRYREPDQG